MPVAAYGVPGRPRICRSWLDMASSAGMLASAALNCASAVSCSAGSAWAARAGSSSAQPSGNRPTEPGSNQVRIISNAPVKLPVGGDDQVPVIGPGEPFGLALAAAVRAQLAAQVRAVSGPVADHAGDADPAAAPGAPAPADGQARSDSQSAARPRPHARCRSASHNPSAAVPICGFAGQAPILSRACPIAVPGPDQPGRVPLLPRREPRQRRRSRRATPSRVPPGIAEPVRAAQTRRSLPIPVRLSPPRARARPRTDRPGPCWRTADHLTAPGPGTGVFAGSPRTRRAPVCARPTPALADRHRARSSRAGACAARADGRPPRIALTASRCSFACRSIGLTQPVSVLRHPHEQAAK